MSSLDSLSFGEPDYKSSKFFDVNFGTDKQIFDRINEEKVELANIIRKRLHQDINKSGFTINIDININYSTKVLNVLIKMLEVQKVKLEYQEIKTSHECELKIKISYIKE
jgi:hypothetical protein